MDNGDLEPLADCTDRRRIVLGRTGAGKSALLYRLAEEQDAIVIKPETLSFNYITNSTVLQFFLEAGVKLDLFFKLLWRHVFTVELLKWRYDLNSKADTETLIGRLKNRFTRDAHKKRAVNYLLQWGDQFWEETEYRIKEITQRVERDLCASVAGRIPAAALRAGTASKLSEEEKAEVVQRGKSVVNSIQMRELTDVLQFLNEDVFDADHRVYVLIDKLDENWVDESFRYLLIRSLIETVRDFLQVRNVKIIAALRTDLIERVFRFTRDAGFQEEKYRSLYLALRWNRTQLLSVLNKRVNYLVRQTYTKQRVGYVDLVPAKIGKDENTAEYLLDRTLMRPRELIEFFNSIIELAATRPAVTKTMILEGEGLYSKNRMRSLQDEWISDYPSLIECAALLKRRKPVFRLHEISKAQVEDFCLDHAIADGARSDLLSAQARAVAEGIIPWTHFLSAAAHVFYLTGVVGLKTEHHEGYQWAHEGPATIVADTITMETGVKIHPMFHRVLGVSPR
ncbi:MAG TPA: hypothetical protein VFW94_02330 [Candidatus Acidoferrales bacterium]|nr:hypothetical protein [Candidatus Acidoferrales bacterium]